MFVILLIVYIDTYSPTVVNIFYHSERIFIK